MSSQLPGAVFGFGAVVGLTGFMVAFTIPQSATVTSRRRRTADASRARRGLLAATVGVATLVLTRWPVGAAVGAAGSVLVPDILTGRARRDAAIAKTEAVAGWAEMLRDTLSAAAGLEETIVATAPVAPEAIRAQLCRLMRRLEHARLDTSLYQLADELADPTADLVISALIIASVNPVRDLGSLVGSLASSARQRAAMQLRVDAGRARTRTAVRIVTLFTIGFTVGMLILNRGYLAPFDDTVGQGVLAVVGLFFLAAFWLLDRIARIPDPERCLVRAATTEPRP